MGIRIKARIKDKPARKRVKVKRREARRLNSSHDFCLAKTRLGTPMESKTSANIRKIPRRERAIKKPSVL